MSTGIAVPVRINKQGGLKLISGDENDSKTIFLSLGDDDNENAFQQNIGLGIGYIFGISDELIRAKIIRRLKEVFDKFESQKRFVLKTDTIKWSQNSNQELVLEFKYICIESDEEKTFVRSFSNINSFNSG